VIVNSQKSIYKPNLKRADSSVNAQKPPKSTQVKRGDSSAKIRQASQQAQGNSGMRASGSRSSFMTSKQAQKVVQGTPSQKASIYKPPTIPIYQDNHKKSNASTEKDANTARTDTNTDVVENTVAAPKKDGVS